MKKRILAWILLIGFVLLIINLLTFRLYLEVSLIIYTIVALTFVFLNMGNKT